MGAASGFSSSLYKLCLVSESIMQPSPSSTVIKRWRENDNLLTRVSDGLEIKHPSKIPSKLWVDDMKLWPPVEYKNIFNYFVLSESIDGESMENFKSMESYQYFHADKVGTVFVYTPADGLTIVQADVTPSQSVNNLKHKAWVLLTSSGVVETAGCGCIAGRGRSCSHAGAILWKLEYATTTGRSGAACTDTQQSWNRGTCSNLEPKRIQEISFKRKSRSSKRGEDALEQLQGTSVNDLADQPVFLSKQDFTTAVEQSSMASMFKLQGTLLNKCFTAQLPQVSAQACETVHGAHSSDLSCTLCKTFYVNNVFVQSHQINDLEVNTREQSSSVVWRDARRVRITASSGKKVPSRATTNPEKFLREHLYPTFRGNAATQHGKVSEPRAIQTLQDMGFNIFPKGTIVCQNEPWLSGSPDGVTDDGVLVEVKCPLLKTDAPVQHFEDLFSTRFCDVILQNGKAVLEENGPRGYYMQVQLTMFCTGLKKCIFFIWTDKGHLLLEIKYNEEYVCRVVNRLKGFYFASMLPRLSDDFAEGRLKLCREYTDIVSK